MNKSVMTQVINHFSGSPLSKWRIDHKRLWLEYLETGQLPFTSKELHRAIQEIVDKPENRPRGEKLLHFHKKNNFTLKADKIPYRPEEALERFIVVSNEDNFFNQVPVGGGKESIDLVIRHNENSVEFVELKPWNSSDSPLYALVEGLKNLLEYRIIIERQIREVDQYEEVVISMLAPEEYYRNFFLLDDSGSEKRKNISMTTKLLDELATEFGTKITLHSFILTSSNFNQACSRIYDQMELSGQQIAAVTKQDDIASLRWSNWTELASSDTIT